MDHWISVEIRLVAAFFADLQFAENVCRIMGVGKNAAIIFAITVFPKRRGRVIQI